MSALGVMTLCVLSQSLGIHCWYGVCIMFRNQKSKNETDTKKKDKKRTEDQPVEYSTKFNELKINQLNIPLNSTN